MRNRWKKMICIVMAAIMVACTLPQALAQAKSEPACKALCAAGLKATGGIKKLKYKSNATMDFGALSSSDRKKVREMQYVFDAKEVYSLCVIKAKNVSAAKSLFGTLKKYKQSNCKSNYLSDYSSAEKKVFQNAVCGKKGKYVWYIAMSPSKKSNNKGQTAIKKNI